jgi:CheY-like chemotaxis protein/anti-sigma regulatory factor (Ser/Thr protein kinase)
MPDPAGKDSIEPRILLVDDQPSNLTALAAILEPLGYPLVRATSGREALKHLLMQDFAVILLDVQMPGMDGFETATHIKGREASRNIPIIFVTAVTDSTFIQQAYGTGAVDYLTKPYDPTVLKSKVSVFVDLYVQREQIKQQSAQLQEAARREMELQRTVWEREKEQRYLTELARREAEKSALAQEVAELAKRQRAFVREVLASLTEGRLHLCDTEADLPPPLPPFADPVKLTIPTLRELRIHVRSLADAAAWQETRTYDFETAVAEAGMNSVVHGKAATGQVCLDAATGRAQVWIRDSGSGISEDRLHRATLERGYTTAGTLGHGFWIMLKTADRVYLLTGKSGTTIVLEQEAMPPPPSWQQHLTQYDAGMGGTAPVSVAFPMSEGTPTLAAAH